MTLDELMPFQTIYIQCHNNPDADALASGFALWKFFTKKGKQVTLFYGGTYEIQKSNLLLMINHLQIPVVHRTDLKIEEEALLLTVDCQYGSGNVEKVEACHVAVVDHHQQEIAETRWCEIQPALGSCSTLVWKMLSAYENQINSDIVIGTALYYGLYTDTNQFSEIFNPIDMDMKDSVRVDKSEISEFRNSNISLKELETAGIALIRNIYNEKYRYAIIRSEPCDPNVLGIISDFLLQVDKVDTCVVYNETGEGIKLSVRSCKKEVRANELADYLCSGIGSGGGHIEKAGGFISRKLYVKSFACIHTEAYFSERMTSYFENTDIIYAMKQTLDTNGMKHYPKKQITIGYVRANDIFPDGTAITIRTMEGDVELAVKEDLMVMIGIKGEIYPTSLEKFQANYQILPGKYDPEKSVVPAQYLPKIRSNSDGSVRFISEYAGNCVATGKVEILARKIEKLTKVFTAWDEEKYMLGKPGDYLAVRSDDPHDIYIIEQEIFAKTYQSNANF